MLEQLPLLKHLDANNFFLIAGPCAVEREATCLEVAETLNEICHRFSIPYIFKASYRKANRSRSDSFAGIGDLAAMQILRKVREQTGVPVLTDIHAPEEATVAAEYADILQIPAFLCRQTELLVAAGETGKFVNIKKGQFLAPEAMIFAAEKVSGTGNEKILLTERGTTFGYRDLVVDFRGIQWMQETGYPVVLDVTHSLQQPNRSDGISGGLPELIALMARAGVAAGVDGIFLETHPEPARALSDGSNMLPLHSAENLLKQLSMLRTTMNQFNHLSSR